MNHSCISNSVPFRSVTQSCLTHCHPIDCSPPGLLVHHQLLEFTQTLVHRVSDAIQPSHPLLSPSPPAPNPSQHQGESAFLMRWPKYWSFSISPSNKYSGLISFRIDRLDLLAAQGILKSLSNTTAQSIYSSVLSFLYSLTLISIHDYWKNHTFH